MSQNDDLNKDINNMGKVETEDATTRNEEYSIGDDRRVKSLSPGALVRRRFFRNRVAVIGLAILIFMFVFSFIGGVVSPYSQDQLFYRNEKTSKSYASVTKNDKYRYMADDASFDSVVQAQAMLAIVKKSPQFTFGDKTFNLTEEGKDFYSVAVNGKVIGLCYKEIFSSADGATKLDFTTVYAGLKAYTNQATTFNADGKDYTIDSDGVVSKGGSEFGYISKYVVSASSSDVILSKDWKDALISAISNDDEVFKYKNEKGVEFNYELNYSPAKLIWSVKQEKETRVYDTYSQPSFKHPLGTDKNGMDMLTRLMYGGRVSLTIGFLVEIIATGLGVILGGLSGYFGGWVDMVIMRIVDVFYCIPSMPLIIILGAVMDALKVDPMLRMVYLMLILGFLGWPGIARLVRGQILSLREQEYMTATEATGLSVKRRIFRHLVPNVIPQLIVSMTMGLGGTIITEATLSFLGLGVKFPFASWGNIINDVNNTFVLTNYWFIWIPAGVLLLLTVLAFNLAGDGLRDAFDPRMNR